MTMITPSYLGETIEYSSLHACRSTLEDPTFLWRGMRASWRTEDVFGRYLAVGITSMVVLQAFINISVVLGMLPTKGIPLPLVSYGGSSLFVTLACVGVLLNITKQAE